MDENQVVDCKHRWKYIETIKRAKGHSGALTEYSKTDRFYCIKCLEQKETKKIGYWKEAPDWY
jgi:hypothetical protein